MYSATAIITTVMDEPGISFAKFSYNCGDARVMSYELSSTGDGREVKATISVSGAPSAHDVETIALAAHKQALRRLDFLYGTLSGFTTVDDVRDIRSDAQPNATIVAARVGEARASGARSTIIQGISSAALKDALEKLPEEADIQFELFNQARTASNEVVEFLGYYQIIASIQKDSQRKVDAFLEQHDPHMPPRTQRPDRPPGETETVYSRLRNEIAHVRTVDGTQRPKEITETKAEIAEHVEGLRRLAVIAIKTRL